MTRMSNVWDESDLRLVILQVLLAARKRNVRSGGEPGKVLMDLLNPSVEQLQESLWCLRDEKLIEVGERVFHITALGVDYVKEHEPPAEPPPSPPSSPGDPPGPFPPKNDPDDPSGVPLRPVPSGNAGEKSLPLPNSHE